ncbi:MAG TPA: conjugal transfer protein TrbL family protein [Symbiobacteriaceae bacterium]|nr:conjugal transfer protein TrbL family protein [Symbiobacteriaceae bacterium]
MGSWVQQTAWNIFTYMLDSAAKDLSNQVWIWFSQLFTVPLTVLDDPTVAAVVNVLTGLVLGFVPVAVAWIVLKETASRLDGTSTTPPEALVRRAMMAGLAITATSLVARYMLTLSSYARELVAGFGVDINVLHALFRPAPDTGLVVIILLLAFLVGGIVLLIQRAVITAETTVLLAIGPIMAAGLLREGGGTTWNIWLRELTSLLVTGLIQMLVTMLFLRKFAGGDSGLGMGPLDDPAIFPDLLHRMAALGYLWVLWNTPRWARQLVYSVGAGGAVVGGAVSMTRLVVMRQIFRSMAKA